MLRTNGKGIPLLERLIIEMSASVYECFSSIWPYNAHSAEVDGQTPRKGASGKLNEPVLLESGLTEDSLRSKI